MSKELMNKLAQAKSADERTALLKGNREALTDDDLEQVAGGTLATIVITYIIKFATNN